VIADWEWLTRDRAPAYRSRSCDEWIALGVFRPTGRIARESYDRIVGLLLDGIAVDRCITEAPGGGEVAGPAPT
jgi:hypothetical protein